MAAKAAVTLPGLFFLVGIVFSTLKQTTGAEPSRIVGVIMGGVSGLILLSGLIASIYALASVPRHGRPGLLGRGLAGLVLNGVFLVLFSIGFVTAFQKARSNSLQAQVELKRLQAANQEAQADMRKELQEKGSIESGEQQLERLQSQYKEAGEKLSGHHKVIMEASAAYAEALQREMKKYNAAVTAFQAAEVLNAGAIENQAQIAEKRTVVENFMAANASLTVFMKQSGQVYEKELRQRKLPEATLQEVLRGFNRSAGLRQPLLMEIRTCDERLGKAALGALDLLDKQYGKWRYVAATEQINFTDDAAIDQYNGFMKEINQAAEDQAAAQEKLLSLKN